MSTLDIPQELKDQFKKFKLGKVHNTAFIMKVNKQALTVDLDEIVEATPWSEVVEELPDNSPRFVAYSAEYIWEDGRKSYPLFFVFWCPTTVSPTDGTLYASIKGKLCQDLAINKIFDSRDKDEMTDEWLDNKLKFFK